LIDEFTRECLAIRVARGINSFGVIEALADAMLRNGIQAHTGRGQAILEQRDAIKHRTIGHHRLLYRQATA